MTCVPSLFIYGVFCSDESEDWILVSYRTSILSVLEKSRKHLNAATVEYSYL